MPGEQAHQLVALSRPVGIAALVATALAACGYLQRAPWAVAENALVSLLAFALEPLVFFTAYFCLLHSPRHIVRVVRGSALAPAVIAGVGTAILAAILAVTLAGAAGAYLLIESTEPGNRLLRVVFVGLSALTVPHLILVERVAPWRPSGGPPPPDGGAGAPRPAHGELRGATL